MNELVLPLRSQGPDIFRLPLEACLSNPRLRLVGKMDWALFCRTLGTGKECGDIVVVDVVVVGVDVVVVSICLVFVYATLNF